jgi:anti-sigma B factor antagonist
MNPTQILVAISESTVFLRLVGRADFQASAGFRHALEELQSHGYQDYAIDLSACPSMDSTFLGLLAVLATRPLSIANASAAPARIALLQPCTAIVEALRELGIIDLFRISDEPVTDAPYHAAEPVTPSFAELARTSIEGHRALMDLHPPNVEKFKDVIEFLRNDLEQAEDLPDA